MLNIFITALLFLLFAPIQSVFMTDDFDTRPLSEKGKKAYENLIVATRFEDAVVGYGGTLSVYARSLEVLINEEKRCRCVQVTARRWNAARPALCDLRALLYG